MAINTTTRQTTAFTSGNNFAFAFKVYEVGDVKVIRITTSTGAEEVLTITTHYTVTLNDDQNANPGGTVTLVNSGNPVNLGSGFNVVITSKVTPLQQTEITNQGGFFPEVINDVLDKAAILDQQQQAILDKTIRFPLTQTVGGLEITENAANRAGKVVQFDGSGDLVILGTVDGRDVSADGTKLDGIESNATADQTAAEIRTLVESASDSNVFTDADHSKLNAIEAGATGDQNASEIRTLVESANDSNVFTDNDHTKLNNIEDNATRDQTASEIKTLLQSDKLTASELANNSVTVSQIQDSQITAAKLNPATVITASEQASATTNDTSFLTSAAADARFFNISTAETIKDGDTFPDNDTTIATTAAINDRIIDLVDDVGGFVPIANETSFPTANPDAENGTGTVVSVKAASTNLTPSGTTVTIANGAGTGNTVTITGVPSVIPSGFGFIVETTSTLHTYTFHRLVPKATEVTTVAGKAVEIGRLGTADAVADMAILGTTDVVADLNMLATTDIVADMALLATTDVIADMALLAVTDVISDMNDLATSANITAMANCSNSISSINNASSNLNSVNNFGDTYQVAANDPTTDGGGNSLAEGDLYFNTSANRLKVYDGSSWVNGVEISGAGAVTTGNTFTGDNRYNDGVKALFGTGSDLEIFHDGNNSLIRASGTGDLNIYGDEVNILNKAQSEFKAKLITDGAVELYYDNSKKFETTSTGATLTGTLLTGALTVQGTFPAITLTDLDHNPDWILYNANGHFRITDATNSQSRFSVDTNGHCNVALNLRIPNDTGKIQLGASQDLEIYHDGSDSKIVTSTGDLWVQSTADDLVFKASDDINFHPGTTETGLLIKHDAGVEAYYDNSKKFETTSDGIQIDGTATNLTIRNGTVSASAGGLITFKNVDGNGVARDVVRIKGFTGGSTGGYGELTLQTAFANTLNDCLIIRKDKNVELPNDNQKLKIGAGQDLELFHDSVTSRIDSDSKPLMIRTINGYDLTLQTNSENAVICKGNGAVELYYDNAKKLETVSTGIQVTGNVKCNGIAQTSGNLSVSNNDTSNGVITFATNTNDCWRMEFNGDFEPHVDNQVNIGSSSKRAASVYAVNYYGNGSNLTGINTDLVSDTSPQLGGDLDVNGRNIKFGHCSSAGSDDTLMFGTNGDDLKIFHGGNSQFDNNTGNMELRNVGSFGSTRNIFIRARVDEASITCKSDGAVELYFDNSKKFETTSNGVNVTNNHDIRFESGTWTGETCKIQHHGNWLYFQGGSNGFKFRDSGSLNRWIINSSGHFEPGTNNSYDIGSTSARVRNIYTNDLNLSNEGSSNDVDGTWGSYTIQEGAEDLFLINKRNGKKYKFALMEVS